MVSLKHKQRWVLKYWHNCTIILNSTHSIFSNIGGRHANFSGITVQSVSKIFFPSCFEENLLVIMLSVRLYLPQKNMQITFALIFECILTCKERQKSTTIKVDILHLIIFLYICIIVSTASFIAILNESFSNSGGRWHTSKELTCQIKRSQKDQNWIIKI